MTTDSETYVIGSKSSHDDLHEFWTNVLGIDDQCSCLIVSQRDIDTQFALNASRDCGSDSGNLRGKVAKFFINSLTYANGRVNRNVISEAAGGSEAPAVVILQVMERKLVELRSVRSVWLQFTACFLWTTWSNATSFSQFVVIGFLVLFLLGSESRPLIFIRFFVHDHVFMFFNTRVIPSTNAAGFLIGPFLIAVFIREYGAPSHLILHSVPGIINGLLSNFAVNHGAVRRTYKVHVLSSCSLHAVILGCAGYFAGWRGVVVVLLLFHWEPSIAVAGVCFGAIILSLALIKDILYWMRRKFFWKCISWFLLGDTCIRMISGPEHGWRILVYIPFPLLVIAPSPPSIVTGACKTCLALCLDFLTWMIMFGQSVFATIIVFNSSFHLGFQWLKYCVLNRNRSMTKR